HDTQTRQASNAFCNSPSSTSIPSSFPIFSFRNAFLSSHLPTLFPPALHSSHLLPCVTMSTCNPYLSSAGTLTSRCACVASLPASFGRHPSKPAIRHTCVSTAKLSRLRQKRSTHDAVFGP